MMSTIKKHVNNILLQQYFVEIVLYWNHFSASQDQGRDDREHQVDSIQGEEHEQSYGYSYLGLTDFGFYFKEITLENLFGILLSAFVPNLAKLLMSLLMVLQVFGQCPHLPCVM